MNKGKDCIPDGMSLVPLNVETDIHSHYVEYILKGLTDESVFSGISEGLIEIINLIDEAPKYTTAFTSVDFLNKVKVSGAKRYRAKCSSYCVNNALSEALKIIGQKYPCIHTETEYDIVVIIEINDSFSGKKHLLSTLEETLERFFHRKYDKTFLEMGYNLKLPGYKMDKKGGIYIDYGTLDYMVIQDTEQDLIGDDIRVSVFHIKRSEH